MKSVSTRQANMQSPVDTVVGGVHLGNRSVGLRTLLRILALFALIGCTAVPGADAAKKKDKTKEDTPPVFYPSPPDPPRIQFLKSFTTEKDVKKIKKGRFRSLVFGDEEIFLGVVRPFGVAIWEGQIFTCDADRALVVIFDIKKREVRYMGVGTLRMPLNMVIDSNGDRYITDSVLNSIVVFDPNDRVIRSLGGPKEEEFRPTDVAILDDDLYVADVLGARIVVMDKHTGEIRREIGSRGTGEGYFMHLTSLTIDADANLYASDSGNAYVQKFDPRDRFVRQIGGLGDTPGNFARPKGVALDAQRRLYVVDAAFSNVQIFDEDGQILMFFGGATGAPGSLILPAQVVVDYDNVDLFEEYVAPEHELEYIILVTSQHGPTKVNVYGFLKQEE